MKKHFFILLFAFSLFSSCAQEETTTYYLIRHAEKDRSDSTNKNPDLKTKGQERAKKWAAYFKDIELDAIYSTNYNRTLQTAKPTAESKNLEIIKYNPRKMYTSDFQKETKGKTVLIVGHSNTTPAFANKILGSTAFTDIDDSVNSTLFKITVHGSTKSSEKTTVE